MHIAFIIPAFLPARDYGGPLYNTITLSRHYVREGHQVTVYTTNAVSVKQFSKNISAVEEMFGVTVKRFPVITKVGGYWINPSIYHALLKDSFDIIHSQCLRCFQTDVAAHISKKTGKPLIIAAHGSLGSIFSPKLSAKQKAMHALHDFLDKKNIGIAKKLIAVNEFEKSTYMRYNVNEEKIDVIPLGLDVSEFEQDTIDFRKKFGIGEEEIIVLYVGRYNYVKGLNTLIKAFAQVVSRNPSRVDLRLVLIGKDDGYYNELVDLVGTSNASDRIVVLENQPREVIISAYVACDIFVIPSHFDTFPVTMLEALSCGKALIASKVGGIPEVIEHDRNGVLVEARNVESLASSMEELIRDESKRLSLGGRGRAMVKNYDISRIAARTLQLYSQLTK
jgi:glycosyltransferase involved in cell wall biosynthesis